MRNIFLFTLFLVLSSTTWAFDENPILHIYTDNIENEFQVGNKANIFVEILSDIEFPNGDSEITLAGKMVGVPDITLKTTKISKTLYSFTSEVLLPEFVGRRYFNVEMKIRSKKSADRIRKAIEKNGEAIQSNIASRDNANDDETRAYYQNEIDRLMTLNDSLIVQLDHLYTTVGGPGEAAINIISRFGESVSVVLSKKTMTVSEGQTNSYSVVLDKRPSTDVVVLVSVGDDGVELNDSGTNQVELLFTPENYSREQIVKVKTLTNSNSGDSRDVEIQHKTLSRDYRYNELPINDVTLKIMDTSFMRPLSFL